jgi:hypothetical protein
MSAYSALGARPRRLRARPQTAHNIVRDPAFGAYNAAYFI